MDRAFGEAAGDVPRALTAFERERRPIVEKIVAAANASSYWYERIAEKMKLEPWQLAYDYMMHGACSVSRNTDTHCQLLRARMAPSIALQAAR